MTPYAYCRELVKRAQSNFLPSVLFLPRLKKEALIVLYAFCRAVDDCADGVLDKALAHKKLTWWRQEVDNMFSGKATHLIGQAFQEKVNPHFELPLPLFMEMIDGMEMDLSPRFYHTFEDLKLYCHRVAGVVGILIAKILGYSMPATERYAEHLGIALQLVNIIRDLGEDASRKRLYLPLEDCERFHVSLSEIFERKWSSRLALLLAYQGERARMLQHQALSYLAPIDRSSQKRGQVMADIYFCLLNEIEREGWNTLHYRFSLPAWRKVWIAFKALTLNIER